MGLFDFLKKDITGTRNGVSEVNRPTSMLFNFLPSGEVVWYSSSHGDLLREGFLNNHVVFSILDWIGQKVSACPPVIYKVKNDKAFAKYKSLLVNPTPLSVKQALDIRTIVLKHNECPATMNVETGEIKVLATPKKVNNNPDLIEFEPSAIFSRSYSKSWEYLYYKTNDQEFKVAQYLAFKAKAFTNSLEPLSDESTVREIAEATGISIGKVTIVFSRLFTLGVYGKWEVSELGKGRTKYWIFNPYLSFNGKRVDKNIVTLFENTAIAKAFKS